MFVGKRCKGRRVVVVAVAVVDGHQVGVYGNEGSQGKCDRKYSKKRREEKRRSIV